MAPGFTWSAQSVLAKIVITYSTIDLRLESLEADLCGMAGAMNSLTAAILTVGACVS